MFAACSSRVRVSPAWGSAVLFRIGCLLLAAAIPVAFCPAAGAAQRGALVSDTTIAVDASPLVNVQLVAGGVTVRGWERRELRMRASGGAGALLSATQSLVRVSVPVGARTEHLELMVPQGSRIVVVANNGDIDIARVAGGAKVEAVAGEITLTNVGGSVDARATAGNVNVTDATGTLRALALAGNITIDGARDIVEIEGINGSVVLRRIAAPRVTVTNVSGSIQYEGMLERSGSYRFETFAGSVELRIPESASARFTVDTFAGRVRTGLTMVAESGNVNDRGGGARRVLRLGSGEATVTVKSYSGSVTIDGSR